VSNSEKQGSVLPDTMRGTRRPSSSCWPSSAAICDAFTIEPLAPVMVIAVMQLDGNGLTLPEGRHALMAADVTLDSAPELRMSNSAPPALTAHRSRYHPA